MSSIIPNIDEERHIKIYNVYGLSRNKWVFNIKELKELLYFDSNEELFYWISRESIRFQYESAHNFINVGSPYNHLLQNIVRTIDKNHNSIICDIIKNQRKRIESDLSDWIEHIKLLEQSRHSRKLESERKEKEIHDKAVKVKSEKASKDIFNAIKRKDVNAIISLRIKGADLNFKNESGLTALEYAKQIGEEKIISALIDGISNL